jgi:protein-disulfide isomerase
MPSGKQSKRRRQAAKVPPPPVRTAGRRQASPRVLIAAAAIVVLVAVGIVLGVVLSSGGSSSPPSAAQLPDATDVRQLFAGIPQHGQVLGRPTAPVTMVEYIDLQCPYCQQFETTSMPSVIRQYVRTGKLKVESRPVAVIGPDSLLGQQGALAAARQNKMFDFAQLLYDNQGTENTSWLKDPIVKSAAASIRGLDKSRFLSDLRSSAVSAKIRTINGQATAIGLNKTPTVLVGKTGTTLHEVDVSPTDPATLIAAVKKALRA